MAAEFCIVFFSLLFFINMSREQRRKEELGGELLLFRECMY